MSAHRYILIRDDAINALTPPAFLEQVHRRFLARGLPVNLAVIPKVYTDLARPGGAPEGFLVAKSGNPPKAMAIGANGDLVKHINGESGYHLAMHGYHHTDGEFTMNRAMKPSPHWHDVIYRVENGEQLFREAGLPKPIAFVAPYNGFSRLSLDELARRFRVILADNFPSEIVPLKWSLHFGWRTVWRNAHWRVGRTRFLTHPPSPFRGEIDGDALIAGVERTLAAGHRLTVLTMRWWEFFPNNQPDARGIAALQALADWLASRSDLRAVSFADVAGGRVRVN